MYLIEKVTMIGRLFAASSLARIVAFSQIESGRLGFSAGVFCVDAAERLRVGVDALGSRGVDAGHHWVPMPPRAGRRRTRATNGPTD